MKVRMTQRVAYWRWLLNQNELDFGYYESMRSIGILLAWKWSLKGVLAVLIRIFFGLDYRDTVIPPNYPVFT